MIQDIKKYAGNLRPQEKIQKKSWWIGGSIFILAISTSSIWFIFISGFFRITQIEVSGISPENRGEVEGAVFTTLDASTWKPWDKRNIFYAHTDQLSDSVRENIFAEKVSISKIYPNILRLIIVPRQRRVVIVSRGQQLLVDIRGVVSEEADERMGAYISGLSTQKFFADATHIPVIITDLPESVAAGYQVTDTDHVKRWILIYKTLIESRMQFRYMAMDTLNSRLARLKASDGTDILIDIELPLEPQIDTYAKFFQNKTKEDAVKEYVDVRVPGKIFVK